MKSSQTRHRTWIWAARSLLIAFAICGIAQNHARGSQSAIPQDSPVHCDTGVSRHSLHAASLVEAADVSASAKTDSHTVPNGMIWIPGGRFWMGSNHVEDAQPVHQVEIKAS